MHLEPHMRLQTPTPLWNSRTSRFAARNAVNTTRIPTTIAFISFFSEGNAICIRGNGSEIAVIMDVGNLNPGETNLREGESLTANDHRDFVHRHLTLARQVRKAYNLAKKFKLISDFAMAPLCTRFIMSVESKMVGSVPTFSTDTAGLKLGHVLRHVYTFCKFVMEAQKEALA
jgi:hypothetical protein